MYCQKHKEKEEIEIPWKPRGVSVQKNVFFNAIKKFTEKRTLRLTTEGHCALRKSCFDAVMKTEAKLERGD